MKRTLLLVLMMGCLRAKKVLKGDRGVSSSQNHAPENRELDDSGLYGENDFSQMNLKSSNESDVGNRKKRTKVIRRNAKINNQERDLESFAGLNSAHRLPGRAGPRKLPAGSSMASPIPLYTPVTLNPDLLNLPFVVGGYIFPMAQPDKCDCKTIGAKDSTVSFSPAILFGYEHLIRMKHFQYFNHWMSLLKQKYMPMDKGWLIEIEKASMVHSKFDNGLIKVYPTMIIGQKPYESPDYELSYCEEKAGGKNSASENSESFAKQMKEIKDGFQMDQNRYVQVPKPISVFDNKVNKYTLTYDMSVNPSAQTGFSKPVGFHMINEHPFEAISGQENKAKKPGGAAEKADKEKASQTPYLRQMTRCVLKHLEKASRNKQTGNKCKEDIQKRLSEPMKHTMSTMNNCFNGDVNTRRIVYKHGAIVFRLDVKATRNQALLDKIMGVQQTAQQAGTTSKDNKNFTFFLVYLVTVKKDNQASTVNLFSAFHFPKKSEIKASDATNQGSTFSIRLKNEPENPIPSFTNEQQNGVKFIIFRSGGSEDSKVCKNIITGIKFGIFEAGNRLADDNMRQTLIDKNLVTMGSDPSEVAEEDVENKKEENDDKSNEKTSANKENSEEGENLESFEWCLKSKDKTSNFETESPMNCDDLINVIQKFSGETPTSQIMLVKRIYKVLMSCTENCDSEKISVDFLLPYAPVTRKIPLLNVKVHITSKQTDKTVEKSDIEGNAGSKGGDSLKNVIYEYWPQVFEPPAEEKKEAAVYEVIERVCFSIKLTFSDVFRGMFKCFTFKTDSQKKASKNPETYLSEFKPVVEELERFHLQLANIIRSQFTIEAVWLNIGSIFKVPDHKLAGLTPNLLLGLEMFGYQIRNADGWYPHARGPMSEIVNLDTKKNLLLRIRIQASGQASISVNMRLGSAELNLAVPRIFVAEIEREKLDEILEFKEFPNIYSELLELTDSLSPIKSEILEKEPFASVMEILNTHITAIRTQQNEYFTKKFTPVINGWIEKVTSGFSNDDQPFKNFMDKLDSSDDEEDLLDINSNFDAALFKDIPDVDFSLFQNNIYTFEHVAALLDTVAKFLSKPARDIKLLTVAPQTPSQELKASDLLLDFDLYKGPMILNWSGNLPGDSSESEWLCGDLQASPLNEMGIVNSVRALSEKYDFNHVMFTYGLSASDTPGQSSCYQIRVSLYEVRVGPLIMIHAVYATQFFLWEYMHGFEDYRVMWMQMKEAMDEVVTQYGELAALDKKSFKNVRIDFNSIDSIVQKQLNEKLPLCRVESTAEPKPDVSYYMNIEEFKAEEKEVKTSVAPCPNEATRQNLFRVAQLYLQEANSAGRGPRYVLRFYGLRFPKKSQPLGSTDKPSLASSNSFISQTYSFTETNFENYEDQIRKFVEHAYLQMFAKLRVV